MRAHIRPVAVVLIEVLAGLAMRVDDKRIPEALLTRLKEEF